ncbi:hypothetical protein AX16_010378 [Volvariella volvacea WC 439]|nr:hypothetical protein AX16_010378 [Volvariella volvacea WC 439]
MVSQLIRLTVETGAITTVAASLELFLFLMYTDTFLHIILETLHDRVLCFFELSATSQLQPLVADRWFSLGHVSR